MFATNNMCIVGRVFQQQTLPRSKGRLPHPDSNENALAVPPSGQPDSPAFQAFVMNSNAERDSQAGPTQRASAPRVGSPGSHHGPPHWQPVDLSSWRSQAASEGLLHQLTALVQSRLRSLL